MTAAAATTTTTEAPCGSARRAGCSVPPHAPYRSPRAAAALPACATTRPTVASGCCSGAARHWRCCSSGAAIASTSARGCKAARHPSAPWRRQPALATWVRRAAAARRVAASSSVAGCPCAPGGPSTHPAVAAQPQPKTAPTPAPAPAPILFSDQYPTPELGGRRHYCGSCARSTAVDTARRAAATPGRGSYIPRWTTTPTHGPRWRCVISRYIEIDVEWGRLCAFTVTSHHQSLNPHSSL